MAEKSSAFEPVEVELDKKRRLRFTLGSLRRAQRRLDELRGEKLSIFKILSPQNQDQLGPDEIVVLIHQGLLADDPALTEEQVENMIDARNMEALALKLAEALGGEAAPRAKGLPAQEGSDNGASPLALSPGSTSGRSEGSS